MADKILKALEGLKSLKLAAISDTNQIKKEKISACIQLADQIAALHIGDQSIPILTNRAIDSLIHFCDDSDVDVRSVADESLNRVIRTLSESAPLAVLTDLRKQIQQNGPARCVRTALSKFAAIVYRLRASKGRGYASHLTPCLIMLTARPEESVHETLSKSIGKIWPALSRFSKDIESRDLLKAFIQNLSSDNAVIRRSAASSLASVVAHSHKSSIFMSFALNCLMDKVVPVSNDTSIHLLLGTFNALRCLLPIVFHSDFDSSIFFDKLLQIYELCLHYADFKDHNIVTISLETLNILLTNCSRQLKLALLQPSGLTKSHIHFTRQPSRSWARSQSIVSVAGSIFCEDESSLDDNGSIFQSIILPEPDVWKINRLRSFSTAQEDPGGSDTESVISEAPIPTSKVPSEVTTETNTEHVADQNNDDLPSLMPFEFESNIDVGSFTDPALPLLFCCRKLSSFLLDGVPGSYRSDKSTRVSVKSIAFTCLSGVIKLCPQLFSVKLTPFSDCEQRVSDILLLAKHTDPQIRGVLSVVVGSFIGSLLTESKGRSVPALDDTASPLSLHKLLELLNGMLQDESHTTSRLTLSGVRNCLDKLLSSEYSSEIVSLLHSLSGLAVNNYWLNKVRLIELLCELDYIVVCNVTGHDRVQNDVFNGVIIRLLGDADGRVRRAAAEGLVSVLPKLSSSAMLYSSYTERFSEKFYQRIKPSPMNYSSLNLFPPYSHLQNPDHSHGSVMNALSRVVAKLTADLIIADDKHYVFGIVEALRLLSEKYPPVIYTGSWYCSRHRGAGISILLQLLISYVTTCSFFTDLPALENATTLIANLYAGHAVCALKMSDSDCSTGVRWPLFANDEMVRISDDLLTHLLTVLNIYTQLLEAPPTLRGPQGRILQMLPSKKNEKDELSHLNNPHYAKLQKALKNSLANYKMCIDDSASESLLSVLSATLLATSSMLEMCLEVDSAHFFDELLTYTRAVVSLQPIQTITIVIQLLRSLFAVNLPNYWLSVEPQANPQQNSFYDHIFRIPDELVADRVRVHIAGNGHKLSTDAGNKKKFLRTSTDLSNRASYVQRFEAMVVKSMQIYTTTTDTAMQCIVLTLVTQLVQVKINYLMLDTQLTFFNYVKGQFEYIERGQIAHIEDLLPKIFKFFVTISCQPKPLMTIPDMMQMFVGLMAIEQDKEKHCVPGLMAVVKEVFMPRQHLAEDRKEAETHKEVLLATLLRLAMYRQVLEALLHVLRSDDQVSGQIAGVVLPLVADRGIKLEDARTCHALGALLSAISTNVFHPADAILRALFVEPPDRDLEITEMTRWLAGESILLEILLSLKEDAILKRIKSLVHPVDLSAFLGPSTVMSDPLLVAPPSLAIPPAQSLARLIMLAISRSAVVIAENPNETDNLETTLSGYFVIAFRLLQSGTFHETTTALQAFLQGGCKSSAGISNTYLQLAGVRPILTCQYLYLLALIGCPEPSLWLPLLSQASSFPLRLVQRGAVVALSDYLSENVWDIKTLEMLTCHIKELLELHNEAPVCELLTDGVTRSDVSSTILTALSTLSLNSPATVERALNVLELIHPDHSGGVAKLLIIKFLRLPLLALSRKASGLACRRMEYLLTLPQDAIFTLLPVDAFKEIRHIVEDAYTKQKLPALAALVAKIGKQVYQEPEISTISEKQLPMQNYQSFSEKWFFSLIKEQCSDEMYAGQEMGQLLLKLGLPNVQELFAMPNFHVSVLRDCFVAVRRMVENSREKLIPYDVPLYIPLRDALFDRVRTVMGGLSGPDFVPDPVWLLAPAVTSYLNTLPSFTSLGLTNEDLSVIVDFSMHCLYRIAGAIESTSVIPMPTTTEVALDCISSLLNQQDTFLWLGHCDRRNICDTALRACVVLVRALLNDLKDFVDLENVKNCVDYLVAFLLQNNCDMPEYILKSLRRAVILLCRLPHYWSLAVAVPEAGDVEADTLQQLSIRVNLFGWTTRGQFEEVWAALLGGFSIEHAESAIATQAGIAALDGISVLMQGTLLTKVGDFDSAMYEHGRDVAILHECADRAPRILTNDGFQRDLEALPHSSNKHRPGLLSVENLWSATQLASTFPVAESADDIRKKQISDLGLDLTSCIRFLLDVFSQWTLEVQDQYYLAAALKTSLVISDQFSDPSQFRALLDVVLAIEATMSPNDLPLLPLCIIVTAKCIAALLPGAEVYVKLRDMICRSDSPAARLAALQGLLYLLQSPVVYWRLQPSRHLGNSMFYIEDNETVTQLVDTFVPVAIEILLQFVVDRCPWSEAYEVHSWSLLAYLLLHYRQELGDHREDFVELLLTYLSAQSSSSFSQTVILYAVERLMVADCLDVAHIIKVNTIAENLVGQIQPSARLHGYQLLLTASFINKRRVHTGTMDPDSLMEAIVRLGLILNRLKKATPVEAKQTTMVLGYLLKDLQPIGVLTKLIQEFLSPQHPYTHLLAALLFQIMEDADQALLHDWVVFSLPSLVHGVNASTAIRTIICLFLSASRDLWLRAAFPITQTANRAPIDDLAVVIATHFYSQLKVPKQQEEFREVFQSAAPTHLIYDRIFNTISFRGECTNPR